jgi:hypothetical protein
MNYVRKIMRCFYYVCIGAITFYGINKQLNWLWSSGLIIIILLCVIDCLDDEEM